MHKKRETNLLTVIKKPIITDKTTKLLENNQYCFQVDHQSNKAIVKLAIEHFFQVKVIKINTCHTPLKKRNVGRFKGYKAKYKKAIVTLSSDDTINLFASK